MFTARQIAFFFVKLAHDTGSHLSNLKLQKLLYYAQGWHLGLYGKPLFTDAIEAWVHGPVVPSVYRTFKEYGWNNITLDVAAPNLDVATESYLSELCKVYFGRDAYELELMTHQEAPWLTARRGLPDHVNSNRVITHAQMRSFFAAAAHP